MLLKGYARFLWYDLEDAGCENCTENGYDVCPAASACSPSSSTTSGTTEESPRTTASSSFATQKH